MATFAPRSLVADGDSFDALELVPDRPRAAIVWSFGAGGGFHGPAGGLYDRLGTALGDDGVASIQVAYRRPRDLRACVADVLAAVAAIAASPAAASAAIPIALVGHSFGGAVVIRAALASSAVTAVAALSSQTHGTDGVEGIAPRPLFLLHGSDDEVLAVECSEDILRRARAPKTLVVLPCRHGLDACRDEVDRALGGWLREQLLAGAAT